MVAIEPEVVDNALAVTSCSSSTTCGRPADSADRKSRFTPSAAIAVAKNATPSLLAATSPATPSTTTTLVRLAITSTRWRDQRSRNTPTNGPTSEYGSNNAANAAAASPGVVACSGLNNT